MCSVRIGAASGPPTQRLAIRPYPSELEETIRLGDGRELILRPVRPEDEPAFQAAFAKLTPEEIRLRFFAPMKTLSHVQAARFTKIDYDREMALVLTEPASRISAKGSAWPGSRPTQTTSAPSSQSSCATT